MRSGRSVVANEERSRLAANSPAVGTSSPVESLSRKVSSRSLYPNEITYRRLQAVKTVYDPQDIIQSNHPIPPAK